MTNPADKLSLLMATPNEEPVSQYKGVVQQTDDSKAYVLIDGGTAVWCDTMDVKALVGDRVRVEVRKHKGTLVANYTHPVTDDAVANAALEKVNALEVDALKADSAVIKNLQADTAKVHDLTADQLSAATAYVGELTAGEVTAQSIIADKAKLAQVDTDQLNADHAVIETLDSTYASIDNLNAATARIGNIEADYLVAADMTAEQVRVGQLMAGKADVADLTAANARIDTLQSTKADISVLESDYITAAAIEATYLHADMSNADVAWIQNGVIKDGSISNAMINDVSANKLTAGTINGSVINVTNLNADNITAGTINGQRIGEGSLSLSKLSEDVYTEQEVNNKLATMQAEIDGAIETWTGTAVPTLNNSPASGWSTSDERDRHVGDVYFVVNSNSQQNGYNYRFTKTNGTYSWQLIKDSDVTNALQRLSTAEGKITTFDSDISTLKTDTGTLKTKTESLETRMSDAEDDILDKVDTTTFNEVSDTVDQHSQTITQMSQTLSNKADGSTVTALTTRVSKTEQDITGINTTIGELQDTVETKADGSTVSTISNKLNTVSDTVDGHTQTLTSVQNTLSSKADSSTVSTLTTKVNNVSDTVDGHTQTIGSMQTTQTTMQGKLDKTIVETTQLWYSKSSTDAPSKPTSQVTSTSTAGNAWRTVVPAYNASYPNYFYCYQWKYTDGTYGWSSVTRDIAMGESQERARTAITNAAAADTKAGNAATAAATAQSTADGAKTTADTAKATADKNVKSTLQLWYTKANDTAPAKPTSKVTSTSVSGNAWRTVVPTYSASYPYYFYCYQYELADGTCTWSDVVYDRATTENQSNSRSAVSGVSTLTTKTNTISDTVDGHTSQLSSITTTQTTIQGSAVKSTVLLWFTKANTTAPNKPTAHVTTNNASTANAWNLAVPTYNASYPYYYYCYEHQLLNDTYTWSAVTRDIATEESQSTSRSAASAAAAADTKAGNAASAAAAADTKAGNAAAAAATADGKAVSAQNTANKNVRESQQLWYTKANSTAPAKPTSKVTSTATTGGAWTTRVPTYSDSYKHYFYCMQYVAADGTVTWSDVVYDQATTEAQSVARAASADLTEFHQEYATFKQTTQQFESTVGETYATKAALETTDGKVTSLTGRVSTAETSITQNARDILLRATKTESSQMAQPNLAPIGSMSMSDVYNADTNPSGYWKATTTWFTNLDDGWVRCHKDNTAGTSATNATGWRPSPSPSVFQGKVYTILTEIRNNESTGSGTTDMYVQQINNNQFWGNTTGETIDDTHVTTTTSINLLTCGTTYVLRSYRIADTEHQTSTVAELFRYNFRCAAGSKLDFEFRQSVYEGIYDGPYKPYVGPQLYASQVELKVASDSITSYVSRNYTTKEEFDSLEIGGRNLSPESLWEEGYLQNADTVTLHAEDTHKERTSGLIPVVAGDLLTFQAWVDDTTGWDTWQPWLGYRFYSDESTPIGSRAAKYNTTKTNYVSYVGVEVPSGATLVRFSWRHYGASRSKLEKGNKPTDWTPATEDLDAHFEAVESSITQTADGITESVSKTYSTKDEAQLDRAGSGTAVVIDGAATALLKGLHVIGESVQDGTPTPTAPIPIRSVGPINHIINGDGLVVSGLGSASGSRAEYKAANLGQSYMDIAHGTKVTVSFDLYMTVNTANPTLQVYNTNNKGPKAFSSSASGSGTTGGVTLSFTAAVGSVIDERVSVVGYINDRASGSISVQDNYIEFYSSYGSSNWFSVSNLQMEVDNSPHPFVSYDNIGLVSRGKNLLHTAAVSSVVNGVTFTVNSDGSVTANGTASALTQFGVNKFEEFFSHGDFVLSGCPSGGGGSTYDLRTSTAVSGGASAVDTGNGITFSRTTEENGVIVYITIRSGYACNNLTFYPQIERGDTATEYEPYSGSVTPIPLNGHELRSLPDGTQDELTVDVDGHVTMTQRVQSMIVGDYDWNKSSNRFYRSISDAYIDTANGGYKNANLLSNSYVGEDKDWTSIGDGKMVLHNGVAQSNVPALVLYSTTTSGMTTAEFKAASTSVEVLYPLATPQAIDLGTIDMPQVHDGDTVEVIAALTPSIDVTWWASAGQAVADAYASLSSAIEVRAESIVSTVSERYATSQEVQAISSQITQTAQGWTAQFNQLTGGADLSMTLAEAFEALGVTSRNLEEIRSFVRITTDDAGDPLLLMGSATSPIMLALSNDSLRFMHGSDPVAYIDVDGTTNEGRLHITRAVVVKELQFGSWKWFERDGVGNLALKWVGDE